MLRSPRRFGAVNLIGMSALFNASLRQAWQLKEWWLTDIISVVLYLLIVRVALGDNIYDIGGMDYITYLGYGLLVATCFLRAFQGAAYTLVYIKMEGCIADYLIPPMAAREILAVWTMTVLCHVLLLAIVLSVILYIIGSEPPQIRFGAMLVLALFCVGSASIGHFAALLSQRWDHITAVDSFIFMPITMLSGVFFAPQALPEAMRVSFAYNPLFIVIDSLRGSLVFGAPMEPSALWIAATFATLTFAAASLCFNRGWGVKS